MAKPDFLKWVTDDSSSKITDPGSTKKLAGWIYTERPPFQYFNWLFNRIHKWFLGLQGGYFDIVVGSATQVTNLEATHVIADLDNTLVVAGSKVLFLKGTHTLLSNISLANNDISLMCETPDSIVDVSTFTFTLSGLRTQSKLRIINAGANDINISGAGSKFIGIDVPLSAMNITGGAVAETSGDNGFSLNELVPVLTAGTAAAYTAILNISSYKTGRIYKCRVHTDNTGAMTINFDAVGGRSVFMISGEAVPAGFFKNGMVASLLYDGTNMVLLNPYISNVGSIVIRPIATVPAGELKCDGAAVSRTTYASLFSYLGVTYGNGNGTSTFNLPDYQGEFLRGWSDTSGNDPDAGSRTNRGDGTTGNNVGTKQADSFRSHNHEAIFPGTASAPDGTGGATRPNGVASGLTGGNETRPRNVNVMYCIKY